MELHKQKKNRMYGLRTMYPGSILMKITSYLIQTVVFKLLFPSLVWILRTPLLMI